MVDDKPPEADCALCGKRIWFQDSYSPADDPLCAECDTEVTGREHPPSIPVTPEGLQKLNHYLATRKPPYGNIRLDQLQQAEQQLDKVSNLLSKIVVPLSHSGARQDTWLSLAASRIQGAKDCVTRAIYIETNHWSEVRDDLVTHVILDSQGREIDRYIVVDGKKVPR